VAQRDPILLAKTIATLDHLCEGRFVLGVGAGWNLEEMQNHGVDPRQRWRHVGDHVHAMRTIWTEDVATYHGPFVNFDRIWSWPKPYGHAEFDKLRAAQVTRILLAIKPASYQETTAALDQAVSLYL
jgi:alkanesulfonate monooxygenase SsuD/methylene tetrahydromethanopterin reductase-like flavin-dependent oxidoreductase (luciferase family)